MLRCKPSTLSNNRGCWLSANKRWSLGRCDATNAIDSGARPCSMSCSAIARPGMMWPAVPPPAMTAKTRGDTGVVDVEDIAATKLTRTLPCAAVAAECYCTFRATFNSNPAAASVIMSELPPYEMSGKVSPVTGIAPTTPPILITACTANQTVIPAANNAPE